MSLVSCPLLSHDDNYSQLLEQVDGDKNAAMKIVAMSSIGGSNSKIPNVKNDLSLDFEKSHTRQEQHLLNRQINVYNKKFNSNHRLIFKEGKISSVSYNWKPENKKTILSESVFNIATTKKFVDNSNGNKYDNVEHFLEDTGFDPSILSEQITDPLFGLQSNRFSIEVEAGREGLLSKDGEGYWDSKTGLFVPFSENDITSNTQVDYNLEPSLEKANQKLINDLRTVSSEIMDIIKNGKKLSISFTSRLKASRDVIKSLIHEHDKEEGVTIEASAIQFTSVAHVYTSISNANHTSSSLSAMKKLLLNMKSFDEFRKSASNDFVSKESVVKFDNSIFNLEQKIESLTRFKNDELLELLSEGFDENEDYGSVKSDINWVDSNFKDVGQVGNIYLSGMKKIVESCHRVATLYSTSIKKKLEPLKEKVYSNSLFLDKGWSCLIDKERGALIPKFNDLFGGFSNLSKLNAEQANNSYIQSIKVNDDDGDRVFVNVNDIYEDITDENGENKKVVSDEKLLAYKNRLIEKGFLESDADYYLLAAIASADSYLDQVRIYRSELLEDGNLTTDDESFKKALIEFKYTYSPFIHGKLKDLSQFDVDTINSLSLKSVYIDRMALIKLPQKEKGQLYTEKFQELLPHKELLDTYDLYNEYIRSYTSRIPHSDIKKKPKNLILAIRKSAIKLMKEGNWLEAKNSLVNSIADSFLSTDNGESENGYFDETTGSFIYQLRPQGLNIEGMKENPNDYMDNLFDIIEETSKAVKYYEQIRKNEGDLNLLNSSVQSTTETVIDTATGNEEQDRTGAKRLKGLAKGYMEKIFSSERDIQVGNMPILTAKYKKLLKELNELEEDFKKKFIEIGEINSAELTNERLAEYNKAQAEMKKLKANINRVDFLMEQEMKKISLTKASSFLHKVMFAKSLGVNPLSASSEYISGLFQSIIYASANEDFNFGTYFSTVVENVFSVNGSSESKRKQLSIVENFFGFSEESSGDDVAIVQKMLWLNHKGDKAHKRYLAISMLKSMMLPHKDGGEISFYSAFKSDGTLDESKLSEETIEAWGPESDNMRDLWGKLSSLKTNVIGAYGDSAFIGMKSSPLGKAASVYHTYLYNLINNHFSSERFDYSSGQTKKGIINSVGTTFSSMQGNAAKRTVGLLASVLSEELGNKFLKDKNDIKNVDVANMAKLRTELLVLAGLGVIMTILQAAQLGDDDEDEAGFGDTSTLIALNTFNRLYDDIAYPINPYSYIKLVSNPFAITTMVKDITDLMLLPITMSVSGPDYKSGYYKGENKFMVAMGKMTPVVSSYMNLRRHSSSVINQERERFFKHIFEDKDESEEDSEE
jgi:hypothetical protein